MNGTPPDAPHRAGDDKDAREKLVALRNTLLKLHKALLEMEKRAYVREHGQVNTGELFRLVLDDPQFAWLHNISEFVVRVDETLSGDASVTPPDTRAAYTLAQKMFAPTESGDGFQKKYYDAIQLDPSVVMEHAELAKVFSKFPLDGAAENK